MLYTKTTDERKEEMMEEIGTAATFINTQGLAPVLLPTACIAPHDTDNHPCNCHYPHGIVTTGRASLGRGPTVGGGGGGGGSQPADTRSHIVRY